MVKTDERARIISGLECRVITEAETDRVLEFLAKNYSKQHPVRDIFDTNNDRVLAFDQQRIRSKVNDGVSLGLFVKKTNELVGVEMNSVLTKANHQTEPKLSDFTEKEQIMMDFINFIEGDILKDLKAKKILWMSMGAIAENYRGLNLADMVDPYREQLAVSKGCDYFASLASSYYSINVSKKQGFTTLRKINYSDYVDPKTGLKPDLKLSPVHTCAAVVYKRVGTQKPLLSKL